MRSRRRSKKKSPRFRKRSPRSPRFRKRSPRSPSFRMKRSVDSAAASPAKRNRKKTVRVLVICQRKYSKENERCNSIVHLYEAFLHNLFRGATVCIDYMTPGVGIEDNVPVEMDYKMEFGKTDAAYAAWKDAHRSFYDAVMIGFCPIYIFDVNERNPNKFEEIRDVLGDGGRLIIGPSVVAAATIDGRLMYISILDYPDHAVFQTIFEKPNYQQLIPLLTPFFKPLPLMHGRIWNKA